MAPAQAPGHVYARACARGARACAPAQRGRRAWRRRRRRAYWSSRAGPARAPPARGVGARPSVRPCAGVCARGARVVCECGWGKGWMGGRGWGMSWCCCRDMRRRRGSLYLHTSVRAHTHTLHNTTQTHARKHTQQHNHRMHARTHAQRKHALKRARACAHAHAQEYNRQEGGGGREPWARQARRDCGRAAGPASSARPHRAAAGDGHALRR